MPTGPSEEWTATGSMSAVRPGHTATLLCSGRVLVAGGAYGPGGDPSVQDNSGLATTEVYDPATGSWSATGSLSAPRSGHTATRLSDGRVLVVGGVAGSTPVATAELYDPATGTWSTTGPLSAPRSGHTATLLEDGKVLVSGGANVYSDFLYLSAQDSVATAEVYDPATGMWSMTRPLSVSRLQHTATLLSTGQVLVSGGKNGAGDVATAELYDPATGAWSMTGSPSAPRSGHTATRLLSGQVLITGGTTNGSSLATAELYDPATGTWSTTGSLADPRQRHTATRLNTGEVLVSAGFDNSHATLDGHSRGSDCIRYGFPYQAEVYNPGSGTWRKVGTPSSAFRMGPTATLLGNGAVLLLGGDMPGRYWGRECASDKSQTAEVYSP